MNKRLYLLHLFFPKLADIIYRKWLRMNVRNRSFSIISNNCWAGGVYEDLNLPYSTPTVGLFFYAPCYIEFLRDLNHYLHHEITFVSYSKYNEANEFRKLKNWYYPIGKAGKIEIHFMHYKTAEDAIEKWRRRAGRINFDRLFVKMCDRDLCTEEHVESFEKLPFERKVFFSARKRNHSNTIFLDHYEGDAYVGSLYEEPWFYRKNFNIVKWLNQR